MGGVDKGGTRRGKHKINMQIHLSKYVILISNIVMKLLTGLNHYTNTDKLANICDLWEVVVIGILLVINKIPLVVNV